MKRHPLPPRPAASVRRIRGSAHRHPTSGRNARASLAVFAGLPVLLLAGTILLRGEPPKQPPAPAAPAVAAVRKAPDAAPWKAPKPTALCRVVAKVVTQMMGRYHYSRRPVDDEISSQLFDDYFKRLDPNHYYFLESDIRDFESYRTVLDDLLRRGEVQFAYDVYARFIQRVRERVEYARKRLRQPFDFNRNEFLSTERDKAPWARSRAELDELWRKRLKNQVLVARLADEEKKKKENEQKSGQSRRSPKQDDRSGNRNPSGKPVAGAGNNNKDSGGTAKTAAERKSPEQRILHAYELYLHRLEENEAMDILELYLSTLTRVYDPHSTYMAPDTEEDFDISMRLSLQGIGAVLTTEDEYVKIVGIIPGGPADRDGRLKEGDRIIAVAQEGRDPVDVVNMPLRKVVRLIRGPAGTKVYLTVIEAGKGLGSVPVVIDIVRGKVELKDQEATSSWKELPAPAVPGEKKPGRALVISLPSFYCDFDARRKHVPDYKSTTRDVRRLIEKAAAEGSIAGLILDLRSNGGGSLDEAISVAGLFIPSGPVVQVRDSQGRVKIRKDEDGRVYYDGPLIVLTNRMSASASEIVAAAIQDYHRGVIVGEESTHGKGSVQTVFRLERVFRYSPIFSKQKPGSLKFTMAKFYRVNGGSTQKKGVTPDIVLPSFTDYMEIGEAWLPHVMPWDEIAPLEIRYTIDVTPYLDDLRRLSEQRRNADPEWRELVRDIHQFGERRKRKVLPLNLAARIAYRKEEEEWAKKLEHLQVHRRRNLRKQKKQEDDQKNVRDFMLDEAVHVLADLIRLQTGGGAANVPADAQAASRHAQERPDAVPDAPAPAALK